MKTTLEQVKRNEKNSKHIILSWADLQKDSNGANAIRGKFPEPGEISKILGFFSVGETPHFPHLEKFYISLSLKAINQYK